MNILKNIVWFSIGATAIAVEMAVDTGKMVHQEIKDGNPQELVRDTISGIKEQFESEPEITVVTRPEN